MITDIEAKKINSIVTELFLRGRKHNISLVFISQSYFKVPRTLKLDATHDFIMKIPYKRELQQIAEFKDFMKLYKDHIKELYLFLVNDTTLSPTKSSKTKLNMI